MALSPQAIKADIQSALEARGFVFNDISRLNELIGAVVDAVVSHMQATAVVNTTVTGTSQYGGSVTGTGVGTIS